MSKHKQRLDKIEQMIGEHDSDRYPDEIWLVGVTPECKAADHGRDEEGCICESRLIYGRAADRKLKEPEEHI